MTPEYKRRVIFKLLNGEYKRASGILKLVEKGQVLGHCCLAVMAEVAGLPYPARGGYLTETVMRALGLSSRDQKELANKNDGGVGPEYPFSVISYIVNLPETEGGVWVSIRKVLDTETRIYESTLFMGPLVAFMSEDGIIHQSYIVYPSSYWNH